MLLKRTIFIALALLFFGTAEAQIFTKRTTGPLANDAEETGSGIWSDYDEDGDLDVFVVTGGTSLTNPEGNNLLYRNNGDGTFTKILAIPGELSSGGGLSGGKAIWIDVDNDGDEDLFLASNAGTDNVLFMNNGDGSFTRNLTSAITNTAPVVTMAFADYDNDGNVDLYIATNTGLTGELYRGTGGGNFTQITSGVIVSDATRARSCNWGDYDNDGYMDLLVTNVNFGEPNLLYKNNGNGTFTKITIADPEGPIVAPVAAFQGSYGSNWIDYDNDGDLDLYRLNTFGHPTHFFDNDLNGSGVFINNTTLGLIDVVSSNGGSKWGDIDNDGDLDLYVCDFATNSLFINNGNGTFTENFTEIAVNDVVVESYGASFADADSDGDLDLLVTNAVGAPKNYYYENNGNANHWVSVKGIGTISNTSAVGARVYVTAVIGGNPVTQMREIHSNIESVIAGANPLRTHFGLGDATIIDEIRVEWPASGIIETFNNVAVDQFLKVEEGTGTIAVCPDPVLDFLPANAGSITGTAYSDANNNCVFETFESPVANRMIQVDPGPYFTFSDDLGFYSVDVAPETYDVSTSTVVPDLWKLQPCNPPTYNVTVPASGTAAGNDFALDPKLPPPPVPFAVPLDVEISSIPFLPGPCTAPAVLTGPCPGFNHRYCVTFTNSGTTTFPGPSPLVTLDITLDPNMTFVGMISPSPFFVGTFPNFTSALPIPPGTVTNLCFEVTTNPGGPPWTTCVDGKYDPPGPGNFSDNECVVDADGCPCDPNDKLSTPSGCGPFGNIAQEEELTYRVRFQNIGGTAANDVIIRDVIDEDLEVTSLQIIASSHTVTDVQIIPNNALLISFEGINLPGEITDPVGSNGYVLFKLRPKPGLADGTEITNQAAIYFDQNEAVITNSVLNTVRDNPFPIAEFESTHSCTSTGLEYDFTYTGGTSDGATFDWDFGPDATPGTSTDENPMGIVFGTEGDKVVTLTVTRYGCTSSITHTIEVEDVECKNNKVSVCHNGNLICININALPAHLAHGDCIGACGSVVKSDFEDEVEELVSDFELTIYPNPFQNNAIIEYFVPYNSIDAKIVIQDYTGRIVKEMSIESGQGKINVDGTEINPGIYFYSIIANGQLQESKRMVVTK
jgi:uncharacterized repeat protein (TIGR01451 family)